jgi:hypothetical protein
MSELFRLSVLFKGVEQAADWKHESIRIARVDSHRAFLALQEVPSLAPHNVLVYYWYALDAGEDSFHEIDRVADFWVGRREARTVSLSVALAVEEEADAEWCCTIYAADLDGFLANLSYHLQIAKKRRLPTLTCIHPIEFEAAYRQIAWLKRGGHRMRLALFEKRLISQ